MELDLTPAAGRNGDARVAIQKTSMEETTTEEFAKYPLWDSRWFTNSQHKAGFRRQMPVSRRVWNVWTIVTQGAILRTLRRQALLATLAILCLGLLPSTAPALVREAAAFGLDSPAWAKALGGKATVLAPKPAAAGNNSPAAAFKGALYALAHGDVSMSCRFIEPSLEPACKKNSKGATATASYSETIMDFGVGYVVIQDKRALVGFTGTFCISTSKPKCMTNINPAALFSSGKSFNVLWAEAVAAESNPANVYSLGPCIEVGPKWYFYLTP
jgi:hypothetical protein